MKYGLAKLAFFRGGFDMNPAQRELREACDADKTLDQQEMTEMITKLRNEYGL